MKRVRLPRCSKFPMRGKNLPLPDDGLINDLASAAGIQGEWWEVSGAHHSVGIETKRALLAAMALPIATQGEVRKSLKELAAAQHGNVAVTPGRCYQPEFVKQGKRLYGLTSHLYALRHEGDGWHWRSGNTCAVL